MTHPPSTTSEFESHWVPYLYGFVPHLSKKLSKLPQLPSTKFCASLTLCIFFVMLDTMLLYSTDAYQGTRAKKAAMSQGQIKKKKQTYDLMVGETLLHLSVSLPPE